MTDPAEKMHDYREGFCEGARAIIKAIGDDLPDIQMRVLERWVSGPLEEWRHAEPNAERPPLPLLDGA